jgi:PKD repeat protein
MKSVIAKIVAAFKNVDLKIRFILVLISISSNSFAQNNWIIHDSLPSIPRVYAVGFSIGSSGYVGGGSFNLVTVVHQDFWEYNTVTNVWVQRANLPAPRLMSFCFSINGKGYIGGGWNSTISATKGVYEYDPVLNTWTQKADFGGGYNYFSSGFSIGNFGYVVCGIDSNGDQTNAFWQYEPVSDQWFSKSPLPAASRIGPGVFTIGDNAYVGMGVDSDNDSSCTDLWEYNSILDSWSQKANYPEVGAYHPVAFSAFGKGYFGAGYDSYNPNVSPNRLYEYDPVNNTWRVRAAIMQLAYMYHSPVNWSINNRCFAVTGMIFPDETTTLREYIPDTINISCAANYNIFADTIPHNYFVRNLATGIAPLSYSWDWGDGSTSIGAMPTHTYATAGLYTICQAVTDASGCVDTYCDSSNLYRLNSNSVIINITVVSGITGSSEVEAPINLFCYPNPSSTILNITSSETMISYQLFDVSGNTIEADELHDKSFKISMENLPLATYILEVRTQFGISKRKIVKM